MTVRQTFVLYDADDARAFLAGKHRDVDALTLSPTAHAALVSAGYPGAIYTSRGGSGYWSYGKALVRSLQQSDLFVRALENRPGISSAELWVARYGFESAAFGALRMAATLRGRGPWQIRSGDRFEFVTDLVDAVSRLTTILLFRNVFIEGGHEYRKPVWPGAYRALRHVLLRLLKARSRKILVQRSEHPFGFLETLRRSSSRPTLCHVSPYSSGYLEYLKLLRELWRAVLGSRSIQIRACMAIEPAAVRAVGEAMDALTDPFVRAAGKIVQDRLAATCGVVSGFRKDVQVVVATLRPDSYFAFENADGFTSAIAATCGAANLPRIIMNHNSHTLPVRPLDWPAMRYAFEMQYPPSLTDLFYVWHREAEAVAKRVLADNMHSHIRRIHRPKLSVARRPRKAGAPSRILYAGNPHRWFHFLPWLYETTDDFIDGMRDLCRVLGEMNDIEFVLRLKKITGELDPETIRILIPEVAKWDLHLRRERPFEDDLREADLLVCDMSTTIMQALTARIPVLLWGGGRRYRHLRPMSSPPTAGRRGAVYTTDDPARLRDLIQRILAAHRDRPLTDAELEPYLFSPAEADDADAAANLIVDLDPATYSRMEWDDKSTAPSIRPRASGATR